jgi:hypothetical protein
MQWRGKAVTGLRAYNDPRLIGQGPVKQKLRLFGVETNKLGLRSFQGVKNGSHQLLTSSARLWQ